MIWTVFGFFAGLLTRRKSIWLAVIVVAAAGAIAVSHFNRVQFGLPAATFPLLVTDMIVNAVLAAIGIGLGRLAARLPSRFDRR